MCFSSIFKKIKSTCKTPILRIFQQQTEEERVRCQKETDELNELLAYLNEHPEIQRAIREYEESIKSHPCLLTIYF